MIKNTFNLVFLFAASLFMACQQKEELHWQHLDLADDGVFGISTNKAYKELLNGKEGSPVIVAIMDSGFDVKHEDLQSSLWVNKKEIPGNGIDDDNNGYVDDVHGWNWIGSTKGKKFHGRSTLTDLVARDQKRFSGVTYANVSEADRADFDVYQQNILDLEKKRQEAKNKLDRTQKLKEGTDLIVKQLGKENPTLKDLQSYQPQNNLGNRARSFLNAQMKRKTFEEVYVDRIVDEIERRENELKYAYNLDFEPRSLEGDHPDNLKGRFYGNGDVEGPYPDHGTHVAGIIGADRNNKLGMQGIADRVQLLAVLFNGNAGNGKGDSITAQAIRYAVDQGAKVINMSWGNYYSWDKAVVDEAVKYAVSKDVVLVHAVGNDGKDLDKNPHFPNPDYVSGGKAETWINVGASDKFNDETLRASFSNFGKTQVDVFAPGVSIYSTYPDSASNSVYKRQDGTSMAAPVVTGLAALIRSYYPQLSAVQVKEIILKSVVKSKFLADRCVTGGVVNAYQALQLAAKYSK